MVKKFVFYVTFNAQSVCFKSASIENYKTLLFRSLNIQIRIHVFPNIFYVHFLLSTAVSPSHT